MADREGTIKEELESVHADEDIVVEETEFIAPTEQIYAT